MPLSHCLAITFPYVVLLLLELTEEELKLDEDELELTEEELKLDEDELTEEELTLELELCR
jgi:hypothetical protein